MKMTEEEKEQKIDELEERLGIVNHINHDDTSSEQREFLWSALEDGNWPLSISVAHLDEDIPVAVLSKKELTAEQLKEWEDLYNTRTDEDEEDDS